MFCNAEEMVHISGDADEQDQTKLKDLKGPDRDCYALLKQMQARETAERQESEWKINQVDGMDALRLGTSNPASQAGERFGSSRRGSMSQWGCACRAES